MNEIQRVTLKVSPQLHRLLKVMAVRRGLTFEELFEHFIRTDRQHKKCAINNIPSGGSSLLG